MGDIHTTQQLMGVRVEHAKKPGKRLGRVRHFIFHPTKRKIVGFAVKRPDAALMFHRSDIFVALDGYSVVDGVVMINDDSQSTGRAAVSYTHLEHILVAELGKGRKAQRGSKELIYR